MTKEQGFVIIKVVPDTEQKGARNMNIKHELVPYAKLKGFYAERGIKYSDEAKFLNITISTFSNKINLKNGADFTRAEVASLCKRHNLDANEFFLD